MSGNFLRAVLVVTLVAVVTGCERPAPQPVPEKATPVVADPLIEVRGQTWTTQGGHYTLTLVDTPSPLGLGPSLAWHIRVQDRGGAAVTGAKIETTGGMPQHGHGFPTAPVVTETGDPGEYVIEGIHFHMPGLWQFGFVIVAADGKRDHVVHDLNLQ